MDLTEADNIKKKWKNIKKGLRDLDNNSGVITHLEPDILECEVKWTLGSITMNKASGGDEILVQLLQILKDDAVTVGHSICQQIWKNQKWPQDWKTSGFIPISKKGNAKNCSKYFTVVLISHASKVMLEILQARLQLYMNENFQMCKLDLGKAEDQRSNYQNLLDQRKSERISEKNKTKQNKTSASLTTLNYLCESQQTVEIS